MDKILEVTMLYDFYGELLGEKQREIFEMYYQNDFSLAEIGEILGVSRQAVFDQLKRTERGLCEYERKLSLVARFRAAREKLLGIRRFADALSSLGAPEAEISGIRSLISEIDELL